MNIERLQRKLIAAARSQPPDDRVPYAFEQRIMAHLASASVPDFWTSLSGGLWRALAPCVGLTLLVGAITLAYSGNAGAENTLRTQFESVLYAGVDTQDDAW